MRPSHFDGLVKVEHFGTMDEANHTLIQDLGSPDSDFGLTSCSGRSK